MYCLIDEVCGKSGSRIVFETFDYFQDLKDYVVKHTNDLYEYIPNITKYPDYRGCRSFTNLKRELEKNNYGDWRLTIQKSEEQGIIHRRVLSNLTNTNYITIRPLHTIKRARVTDNGIRCNVGKLLTSQEKKVVLHAVNYRVLHSTKEAVLVEWAGNKGSATTWIPKKYLV